LKLLAFISFFSLLISQEIIDQNHRDYYFPIDNFLLFPKTYVYSTDIGYQYWHLKTIISKSDTIFITSIYDNDFNLAAEWKEVIDENGWEGIDIYNSYYDKSEYLISDIFLWEQDKGHITENIILNTDNQGISGKTYFKREYMDKNKIPYNGDMIDVLIYRDYYDNYPILHYYAKNVGRIKSVIDNQAEVHLVDIIDYHEFSILKYKNNFK